MICTYPNCDRMAKSRGFCHSHYIKLKRKLNFDKRTIQEKIQAKSILRETECIEWIGALSKGYADIRYGDKIWKVSRLIWTLAFGEIPDKLEACHDCDNPLCINLDHLYLATHRVNMEDALRRGRLREILSSLQTRLKK